MKILIINGPNINMLGIREVEKYGDNTYQDLINMINKYKTDNNDIIDIFQSNHEGDIIDKIQEAYYTKYDGIIINPAAYTHTSIGILDAISAVKIPTVEVHITDIDTRENFRKISYIRTACITTIKGEGIKGYIRALDYMRRYLIEHIN